VHGDFNCVENFKDIFKYFDHPKFAVMWDIEHSYKVYERNFIEFFGFIRKYTRHVHVKDTKKIDGKWVLQNLGKGSIPIPMHIALLAASNYDEYISLEWETSTSLTAIRAGLLMRFLFWQIYFLC
jgi:sugar phosphate isomerase/epimerase